MKANELRIGNLLYGAEDRVLSVTRIYNENHIGIGSGDPYTVSVDNPCLVPIPLTEEWLLEFGFGKFISGLDTYFEHPSSELRIYLSANKSRFLPAYFDKMIATIDLLNVHQLQNLYFALTGKELEIKL